MSVGQPRVRSRDLARGFFVFVLGYARQGA
jgi:hypothetical protein